MKPQFINNCWFHAFNNYSSWTTYEKTTIEKIDQNYIEDYSPVHCVNSSIYWRDCLTIGLENAKLHASGRTVKTNVGHFLHKCDKMHKYMRQGKPCLDVYM